MSSSHPHQDFDAESPELLAEDEADEILEDPPDADVNMDSDAQDDDDDDDDGGDGEITLHNDSVAYFAGHKDSVFAIAMHPLHPHIVATGGSEGDADDAPGRGYVLDLNTAGAVQPPVLPPSYAADTSSAAAVVSAAATAAGNMALQPVFTLDGHTDSITALAFTQPDGAFLVSGGMEGRLRAYTVSCPLPSSSPSTPTFALVGEAQETEDISWIEPCPTAKYDAHVVALGAGDGSVWVYAVEPGGLRMVKSYFLHTGSCTAGAWTPDGALLATVSEDGSLHVFDVWGAAAAAGVRGDHRQTVVSLTEADQRFAVENGLYSVAVAPTNTFLAVGGHGGAIKIVGLPRIGGGEPQQPRQQAAQGGKAVKGAQRGMAEPSAQAGTILASIQVQSESIESLSFSPASPSLLLAAGSVDGSIAVLDTAKQFAVRRHLRGAHEGHSVVKVEFVKRAPGAAAGWALTSCGLDGVVRRWDLRGGAAATAGAPGLVQEWRGHRGDGDGGGVLGFVQDETGARVVTAGDDGLVLVFEA